MYLPYLIYYSMPGMSAKGDARFVFDYHFSIYYTNDFHITELYRKNNEIIAEIARDYESFVLESGASFFPVKNLVVGMDFRIISYYGGFLDTVIESYHQAFGFANGGREYVARDKLYIDIENNNNVRLKLKESIISFGDIDLWLKWTFFDRKRFSFALTGALKAPSGSNYALSGSGYPDFGFGFLADFRPHWIISFYLQAGLVVPFDSFLPVTSKPYPMFNGIVSVELNPLSFFSLIAQLNIKSSPLKSSYNHWFFVNEDYLALPQLNILAGIIFKYKDYKWQIYFEEDAVTNSGTDITFNVTFSQKIHLNYGL